MRIILSAFSCDPTQGSEPGVGWTWAYQLAKAGHEVLTVTRDWNRESIEAARAREPLPNLSFLYIPFTALPRQSPGLGVYPYYFAWQWLAYRRVKQLLTGNRFDCVQHITYGSYRTPFFLSFLPIPAIFGPVGGGEVSPIPLIRGLSAKARLRETARVLFNYLSSLNPITRSVWRHSSLILVTTDDTQRAVPKKHWSKTRILPAITAPLEKERATERTPHVSGRCRALFVGRLLEWKGAHLAIQALALARKASDDVTLSIRGDGERAAFLRSLASSEGVENSVHWVKRFAGRDEVLKIYDDHDVLVFPSFHDSGGTVVLEALSRGLPVICLNLGGPGTIVDSSCGAAVAARGRAQTEIVADIAAQLLRFARMSAAEFEEVRKHAIARADQFTAETVIKRACREFEQISGRSPVEPSKGSGHPIS